MDEETLMKKRKAELVKTILQNEEEIQMLRDNNENMGRMIATHIADIGSKDAEISTLKRKVLLWSNLCLFLTTFIISILLGFITRS